MRHLTSKAAQVPNLAGWIVICLSGIIGIIGVVVLDGPAVAEDMVLVTSFLAIGISSFRLRCAIFMSACDKYKRMHRPLAGPKPGARLG
jgi:hypothetical protein